MLITCTRKYVYADFERDNNVILKLALIWHTRFRMDEKWRQNEENTAVGDNMVTCCLRLLFVVILGYNGFVVIDGSFK